MSTYFNNHTLSQNADVIQKAMRQEGFKNSASIATCQHTHSGLPVKDMMSFVSPIDDTNPVTVWSINCEGLTRLCYTTTEDLDHSDLFQDCEGAVIVKNDMSEATKELALIIKTGGVQQKSNYGAYYNFD